MPSETLLLSFCSTVLPCTSASHMALRCWHLQTHIHILSRKNVAEQNSRRQTSWSLRSTFCGNPHSGTSANIVLARIEPHDHLYGKGIEVRKCTRVRFPSSTDNEAKEKGSGSWLLYGKPSDKRRKVWHSK